MSKSDDLRKEAKEAGKRGDKTKSLKEGAREHKREKAIWRTMRIGWMGNRSRKLPNDPSQTP
jgi:hypothetical protein